MERNNSQFILDFRKKGICLLIFFEYNGSNEILFDENPRLEKLYQTNFEFSIHKLLYRLFTITYNFSEHNSLRNT